MLISMKKYVEEKKTSEYIGKYFTVLEYSLSVSLVFLSDLLIELYKLHGFYHQQLH